MPSGYLINESASWTVIVVGEIAGYPNSSNMALGMRLKLAPRSHRAFLFFW
jgi:hypothetical protein